MKILLSIGIAIAIATTIFTTVFGLIMIENRISELQFLFLLAVLTTSAIAFAVHHEIN